MKVKNSIESCELKSIALALADAPATGVTLFRASEKSRLPLSRVRRLLQKHSDYFVNIAESGSYALNRFGPYKGDRQAIIASIDHEAHSAANRRRASGVLFFIVFILFIMAK